MISLHQKDDLRELRPRFQATVAFVVLVFLALAGRLCQLQVLEADHYERRAGRNFIDKVDVEAPRGRIYDVKGHPLATNRSSYTLYITCWARFELDEGGAVVSTPEGKRQPMGDTTRDRILALLDFIDEAYRDAFVALIEDLRGDEAKGRYAQIARRNLSWEEYARI